MIERDGGVVVVCKNKVALVKKPKGYWEIPKGRIEKGEKELEAGLRELEEETGINSKEVRIVKGWRVTIHYAYWFKKKKIDKTVTFFLGFIDKEVPLRTSPEHIDARWIDLDKAIKVVGFEDLKYVLKKVKDYLKSETK